MSRISAHLIRTRKPLPKESGLRTDASKAQEPSEKLELGHTFKELHPESVKEPLDVSKVRSSLTNALGGLFLTGTLTAGLVSAASGSGVAGTVVSLVLGVGAAGLALSAAYVATERPLGFLVSQTLDRINEARTEPRNNYEQLQQEFDARLRATDLPGASESEKYQAFTRLKEQAKDSSKVARQKLRKSLEGLAESQAPSREKSIAQAGLTLARQIRDPNQRTKLLCQTSELIHEHSDSAPTAAARLLRESPLKGSRQEKASKKVLELLQGTDEISSPHAPTIARHGDPQAVTAFLTQEDEQGEKAPLEQAQALFRSLQGEGGKLSEQDCRLGQEMIYEIAKGPNEVAMQAYSKMLSEVSHPATQGTLISSAFSIGGSPDARLQVLESLEKLEDAPDNQEAGFAALEFFGAATEVGRQVQKLVTQAWESSSQLADGAPGNLGLAMARAGLSALEASGSSLTGVQADSLISDLCRLSPVDERLLRNQLNQSCVLEMQFSDGLAGSYSTEVKSDSWTERHLTQKQLSEFAALAGLPAKKRDSAVSRWAAQVGSKAALDMAFDFLSKRASDSSFSVRTRRLAGMSSNEHFDDVSDSRASKLAIAEVLSASPEPSSSADLEGSLKTSAKRLLARAQEFQDRRERREYLDTGLRAIRVLSHYDDEVAVGFLEQIQTTLRLDTPDASAIALTQLAS